jgi:putative phosphoesterase, SbcD/Mre11-related
MDIKGFETVNSLPCLYHSNLDILALSDIHLGLEGSVTSKGGYVPKFQLKDIIDDIREAKQETDASRILVNGDLKNEFNKNYYTEKKEVEKFIKEIKKIFKDVLIVRGNHDNFLEDILERNGIELRDRYSEGGVLFIHGHRSIDNLKEFETVVIGHEHPALALQDEIGVSERFDCILYGGTDEDADIVVLPAFSKISNGTRINETPKTSFYHQSSETIQTYHH